MPQSPFAKEGSLDANDFTTINLGIRIPPFVKGRQEGFSLLRVLSIHQGQTLRSVPANCILRQNFLRELLRRTAHRFDFVFTLIFSFVKFIHRDVVLRGSDTELFHGFGVHIETAGRLSLS